jgi:hypothetical protein
MTKRDRKKPVRPIKTKRDYEGASAVVKGMAGQNDRDHAAELRLQSLLQELDRFDNEEDDDTSADSPEDYGHPELRRRWSDDSPSSD